MLEWLMNLLCKVGFHRGSWVYDSGTGQCAQTRICPQCDERSYRVRHDVLYWQSGGSFSRMESGVCINCQGSQTRIKRSPQGRWDR